MSLRAVLGEGADVVDDERFRLLMLANITAPMGPALVAPLLDSLTGVYGVSGATVGLMVSAYSAPAIVLIPLAGVVADRYGRKPVLVAGLVLFGLGGVAIAFTTDFRAVLACRLLQGVGGSGIVPIVITSLGDVYAGPREAAAQGFRFTVSGLSQTVFPAVAGFLVVLSWRYPLALYGLAVPIAAVVWRYLPEPRDARTPAEPGAATAAEPGAATAAEPGAATAAEPGADDARETDAGGGVRELGRFAVGPRALPLLLAYGLPGFLYFGFLTYVSIVVGRVVGGTPGEAGLIVAVASLAYAASASQTGRVAAAFDREAVPLVGANLTMAAGYVAVAFAPSVAVVGVGAALLGAGFGIGQSLYRSLVTALAPESLRGGFVSLAESMLRIGITVAPPVLGAGVALLAPSVGPVGAIRWTLLVAGVVAAGLAVGLVLAAPTSR
ncbi:MAG: MFS transporter [Halobacteriaceae archaeon]